MSRTPLAAITAEQSLVEGHRGLVWRAATGLKLGALCAGAAWLAAGLAGWPVLAACSGGALGLGIGMALPSHGMARAVAPFGAILGVIGGAFLGVSMLAVSRDFSELSLQPPLVGVWVGAFGLCGLPLGGWLMARQFRRDGCRGWYWFWSSGLVALGSYILVLMIGIVADLVFGTFGSHNGIRIPLALAGGAAVFAGLSAHVFLLRRYPGLERIIVAEGYARRAGAPGLSADEAAQARTRAFEELDEAVRRGVRSPLLFRLNPYLRSLWGDSRWAGLLETCRRGR